LFDVLFPRLVAWPAVFYAPAGDALDLIDEPEVSRQLAPLQCLPDQIPLAIRDEFPHKAAISLTA
jgi:hypothetical protein